MGKRVLVVVLLASCSSNADPGAPDAGIDTPVITPDAQPCGNGVIEPGEQCDDFNATGGDGCSASCQLEAGFVCPTVGSPCIQLVYCGDGIVEPPEQCDDGNSIPGDGCSGTCQTEPNFVCTNPGQLCTSTIICGDGVV